MAKDGTAGDVADAVRLGGSIDSPFAMRARAGVYKSILDESKTRTGQGVEVIDSKKLIASIEQWEKSGKLDALFSELDWQKIRLFQKYAAPLSETADIGGGMMAGALRQEAIGAPTATLMGRVEQVGKKLVRPLVSNDVTAWILSRPASSTRLMLAQTGRVPIQEMGLALFLTEQGLSRSRGKPVQSRAVSDFEVVSTPEPPEEDDEPSLPEGFEFDRTEDGKTVIRDSDGNEFIQE